jgi:hypothetical protein
MLRGANLKTLSKEVREGKKNNCMSYSWSSSEYDTDTLETSDENDLDDIDDVNSSNEFEWKRVKERTSTPERDRRPSLDQGFFFDTPKSLIKKSSFSKSSRSDNPSPVSKRTPTHSLNSSSHNLTSPYPLVRLQHNANSSRSSDSYE